MTFLRKLEIGCGVTTAVFGFATAAELLLSESRLRHEMGESVPVLQWLLVASLIYLAPALLIAIGSYVHAKRLRPWGLPMGIISTCWVVIVFVFSLFSLYFFQSPLLLALNFLFAIAAIVTILVSLLVKFFDQT